MSQNNIMQLLHVQSYDPENPVNSVQKLQITNMKFPAYKTTEDKNNNQV